MDSDQMTPGTDPPAGPQPTGIDHRATTPAFVIDVWSDIVCPFCYLGHAILHRALEESGKSEVVDVRYHSFILHPQIPAGDAVPSGQWLIETYGMQPAQHAASERQLAQRGVEYGLDYRFDRALMVNTLDAHCVIHLAQQRGKGSAVIEHLFRAEFTNGQDVSDHAVLADIAQRVGIDQSETLNVLRTRAFQKDVHADVRRAREHGIRGVPFFLFDGRRAVSGAQDIQVFREALASL